MAETFTATAQVTISATPAKIWQALTNPTLIKQYFMGVEVETDWQVGSPIVYRGEWKGKAFEDKGTILEIEPEKRIATNYWSGFSGLPDAPENYQRVTYELTPVEGGTSLTITQEDITSAEGRDNSAKNWQSVLQALKQLVE